jgi:hypothetical protein
MTATERSTMTEATIRAKAAESASGTTTQPMQVVGVKGLEPETTPRAAEPSHRKRESPVLFPKKAKFVSKKPMLTNGSIRADGHNLDLYGAMLIRRDRICASAVEARWTCAASSRSASHRRPFARWRARILRSFCLREGWAELPIDVTDQAYVEASELAHSRGLGIWGDGPH